MSSMNIDPIKLANQNAKLEDTLPLRQMTRLCELLVCDEGEVLFSLEFAKDSGGQRVMIGSIQADLNFPCQRCGETVTVPLKIESRLCLFLSDSQLSQCPKDYDPLVTGGEVLSLIEMIEDELLLNIPMVAKHPEGECSGELPDFLR